MPVKAVPPPQGQGGWMPLQLKDQWRSNVGVTGTPMGIQSAQLAQKAECLVRIALRSPKPPSTRGSVALPKTDSQNLWPNDNHKPLSRFVANYSAASGLTARSKKIARALHSATKETMPIARFSRGGSGQEPLMFRKHVPQMLPNKIGPASFQNFVLPP